MSPFAQLSSQAGLAPERAPLTRLRASARPVPVSDVIASSRALLPDAKTWARLLGDAQLGATEASALNEVARSRKLLPGALVFCQGEASRGVLLVVEGDVALGLRNDDGSFRTERHVQGPAWLDLSTGLLGMSCTADARVMTPAVLAELPRDGLTQVMERFPVIARRLLVVVAEECRAQALSTHDLMHKDAPARLAAWLHARCQPVEGRAPAGVVQLPMRKRDIASQLAITPETLSRLMRSFSSQGLIQVAGYTVHVLDWPALQRLAQG